MMLISERQPDGPEAPAYLRRNKAALLTVVVGIAVTAVVFGLLWHIDYQELTNASQAAVDRRVKALETGLHQYEDVVDALQGYVVGAGGSGETSVFNDYATRLMAKRGGIQGLLWAPRIAAAAKSDYEKERSVSIRPGFQISEWRTEEKTLTPARLRDEYFPIHALSQADGSTAILGLDLGSEPERRRTLEKARDTGQAAATQLVRLAQNAKGQAGILLFVPVFRPGQPTATTEDRRAALEGFAVGVFRSVDMFEVILERETMPEGYDHFVFDGPSLIVHHRARAKALEEPDDSLADVALTRRVEGSLRFADREWKIVTVISPPSDLGMDSALYAILGAGLIGTILAGYYVRSTQHRTQQLTKLAAGLKATAEALSQEVDKRREIDSSLRIKAARLERFQELTVGRELAMARLKAEVNVLLQELGRSEKYDELDEISGSMSVAEVPR